MTLLQSSQPNPDRDQLRSSVTEDLRHAYRLLRAAYGHQAWWPGESPFEVCVGAILTQSTNWLNVERAIHALRIAGCLSLSAMSAVSRERIAHLIRPAGYFNIKATRLKTFIGTVMRDHSGSLDKLFAGPTPTVRNRLLAISGIGPETADSMLLYAGGHASFVVDAYTRRIFSRHGWCGANVSYNELQRLCETALDESSSERRSDYWGDYHAQLVAVAKRHCRKAAPNCTGCPLESLL